MKKLLIGLSTLFMLFLIGCGGGGSSSVIGTVWVPTDVLVKDINGDGRNDILTLAMVSNGVGTEQGYLQIRQQTNIPGIFAEPVTYAVGKYPWRVVIGDIDGDNAPDLVVSDPTAGIVWLMMQDGSNPGQFLAPEALISGASYYDAVIADLNNDGTLDVAAAGQMQGLIVRYQDPNNAGSFDAQVEIPVSGNLFNIAARDVDGDGLDDVLAWVYTTPAGVYPASAELRVMYQNSNGGFDSTNILPQQIGLNVGRMAITDLNNDGQLDLFAFLKPYSSDYTAQLVVVPQTNTARSFDTPIYTSLSNVKGIDDAVLADLDQDNVFDTAVAGFWPESGDVKSAVNLFINTGSGAFTFSTEISMPLSVSRIGANDLDGDGDNDIILLGSDNKCLVMMQTAPGTFSVPYAI